MMRFSDRSLIAHCEHVNFDYIVVTWLPSSGVWAYLDVLPQIIRDLNPIEGIELHVLQYLTRPDVGYVPNLRAMMNTGFDYGFQLNKYCGLVNTDCYFGPGWLRNLTKHATPNRVINSIHITAATPPKPVNGIVTADLGVPMEGSFDCHQFVQLYERCYQKDGLYIAPSDDYRQAATMPYLFHRRYWQRCGPWELEPVDGQPPDVRFFDRIAAEGAEFALSLDSIVYHAEAIERRGKRPPGAEELPEE